MRKPPIISTLVISLCVVGCGDDAVSVDDAADVGSNTIDIGTDTSDSGQADAGPDTEARVDTDVPDPVETDDAPSLLDGECAVSGMADTLPLPSDDVIAGQFRLSFGDNGGFAVRHEQAPQRALMTSAADNWLTVAATDFVAHEHQGSFDVETNVGERCSGFAIDTVAVDGGTIIAEGSFANAPCGDVVVELQFCEAATGQLAFSIRSDDVNIDLVELSLESEPDERFYGLGEQFPHDTLNLKGRTIPVIAQEGGVGRGHVPISPAVNLVSPGSGGSESTTYAPAPHYLTDRNRSLFLTTTEYAEFAFLERSTRIAVYGPALHGRVLFGDSPLELIERYTEYAGRMPPLPDWANEGAIVALARPLDESLAIVDQLIEDGALIAGVWNQTWSGISETFIGEQVLWNWIQNPDAHPGWDSFVDALEARGARVLCYVNSMFRDVPAEQRPVRRDLYREGIEAGHFVRNADGEPYMLEITAFEVGLLDLTNPAAREWMKAILIDELMNNARCSGWMADFAEALPYDAVLASGESAERHHNTYPVEWAKLNREAVEEAGRLGDVLFFNRSGYTTTPRHGLLMWQGDQLTTWDRYDGLVSALRGLINGGFSGFALNHSDIGGYTSLSRFNLGYSREAEQLKRWTEMNAFSTAFRTHEGNQPGENAQVYDDAESRTHFARFSRVYAALAPYRQVLFQEAHTRGWPVVRHLAMHFPDDAESWRVDDQFLLGSDILVAPVKNKCFTWPVCPYDKRLYLPPGDWVHLWSGETYTGERYHNVAAPIGEPAVFYRADTPVGPEFVDNLRGLGIDVPDP